MLAMHSWCVCFVVFPLLRFASANNFDQILAWNPRFQSTIQTLDTLQRLHNSSAILHFIELTRNFTAEDLVNCRRVSLASFNYTIRQEPYLRFAEQADIAIRTSHFLTNLFSFNLHDNVSLHYLIANKDFYWSLLLANLQSNQHIFGAGLTFSTSFVGKFLNNFKHFTPYIYRRDRFSDSNETIRTNLSGHKHLSGENGPETFHSEWLWKFALADYSALVTRWQSVSQVAPLSNAKGAWTSPYLDCGLTKTWLITYLVPFFKINPEGSVNKASLIGLVFVSVNLNSIDINQCSDVQSFFADTHKCHTSTQCQNVAGLGFRRGAYHCKCRPGYYYPNSSSAHFMARKTHQYPGNYFNGSDVEEAFIETIIGPIEKQAYFYPHNFICLPCEPGCSDCDDNSPCFVKFNYTIRYIVLMVHVCFVAIAGVLGVIVFKRRYTKQVASSRWVMLETILLGSIMLYSTIILRYYESTTITCFLEPWFRELGFAFCYGSIVIKIYRIYAEFQTRKAHRVCVRDKDLLKYLFGIVLIVFGYMSAWTALVIDGLDHFRSVNIFGNSFNFTSRNILDEKFAANGLKFYVCRQMAWDFVTEIGELFFLLSGVYLIYRIRNSKQEVYVEKITLSLSIILEVFVSSLTYAVKHAFWNHPQLHPDHILLLYALRCQTTVTPMICMLFLPKIRYKKPKRTARHRSRHLSSAEVSDTLPDAIDLHSAILSNGEIDLGEINLSDMDPEDIRSELRRVYTQLQIMKNKSICKDNPHISKRRGGRKSHRRFSLQPFHHKHKQHDQEVTEVSKTPEESTASMDGGTSYVPDGPSVYKNEAEYGNSSTSTKSYSHKHP